MKICVTCKSTGFRRNKGYCICDGVCRNPRTCEDDWYEACGTCKGLGFVGKVDVNCDACGAERKKPCVPSGRKRWYVPYWNKWIKGSYSRRLKRKIHQVRHTKAMKLAQKVTEDLKREEERVKMTKELKILRAQLQDFEITKKRQKKQLEETIRSLEENLAGTRSISSAKRKK